MKSAFVALLALPAFASALAVDAWSVPCFEGVCSAGAGQIKLFGTKELLSDISPVSDWIVFDCNPALGEQTIRMVCKYPEATSKCKNLDAHKGAVHKVVRIPKSCTNTGSYFYHVAKSEVSQNQTIPADVRAKLSRSDTPVVRSLDLDYGYQNIPPNSGRIDFSLEAHAEVNIKDSVTTEITSSD